MTPVCKAFIATMLLLLVCGCESEVEQFDLDDGRDYYPLEEGREWIYAYDSIVYRRQFGTIDTLSGYLREVITGATQEGSGTTSYRMVRYRSDNRNGPWSANTVWTIRQSESRLTRIEENLPIVRLVYPVTIGDSWDGLSMIDQNEEITILGDPIKVYFAWDDFEYTSKDDEQMVESLIYNDVLTVTETRPNAVSSIDYHSSVAQYARNVGMISHEHEVLECTNCDPSISWDDKADKGYRLSLRLVSHR